MGYAEGLPPARFRVQVVHRITGAKWWQPKLDFGPEYIGTLEEVTATMRVWALTLPKGDKLEVEPV